MVTMYHAYRNLVRYVLRNHAIFIPHIPMVYQNWKLFLIKLYSFIRFARPSIEQNRDYLQLSRACMKAMAYVVYSQ